MLFFLLVSQFRRQTYIHKCIINNEYFYFIRGVAFQPAFWPVRMESHQKLAHCICTAHHNSMSHYAVKLFNPLFTLSLSPSLFFQVLFVPITSLLLTFHSVSCVLFRFVRLLSFIHSFFHVIL